MIKFLVGFAAASGLSRAQSLLHYRERHGPLVTSIPEFWRHVSGYVQNFALDVGAPSSLDGVSELWFDSWEQYDSGFVEPLYLEHIRPDEQRFADFNSLVAAYAHDVTIFGGAGTPPNKLLRFITRAAGLSADAFREQWETRHAEAVTADQIVRRFATGYVQNRPLRREGLAFQPSESIDGVDEYWFANRADLADFLAAEHESGDAAARQIVGAVTQIATETRVVG